MLNIHIKSFILETEYYININFIYCFLTGQISYRKININNQGIAGSIESRGYSSTKTL